MKGNRRIYLTDRISENKKASFLALETLELSMINRRNPIIKLLVLNFFNMCGFLFGCSLPFDFD